MSNLKPGKELAEKCVNTIKLLAAEGVQKANSGHPGMPVGMADAAFVLWSQFMRFNPSEPDWLSRDRFILSAGHGSMLIYTMLSLTGYDVSIDDLKNFRQWKSKTAGHPEYGLIPGIETTTGPLGQGFSTGVGMALAAKMRQARFQNAGDDLFEHNIYAIVSDGDLMEGISGEAASIAGHLKLGSLVYLYDDNQITIEGSTELAFSEDVAKRFEAYGWHVQKIDGHDHEQIAKAIAAGKAETERPSIIVARTIIAKGSPNKQGTPGSHGAPLGADEIKLMKQNFGFPEDKDFYVPQEVSDFWASLISNRKTDYDDWKKKYDAWRSANAEKAQALDTMLARKIPADIDKELLSAVDPGSLATRAQSGKAIQKIAELIPSFVGGSADLAPSNNTFIKSAGSVTVSDFSGKNLHFGIREHAMGAIMNGITIYGGFIPYGGTFLVFSDYMRGSVRLASIMKLPVIYVFTHDSIFVGEDGPTHQPIEQTASLTLIPNLTVLRPADGAEVAAAWSFALRNQAGPTALILSRQKIAPVNDPATFNARQMDKGGYIVSDAQTPDLVLVASGSELPVALEAKPLLEAKGHKVRVVSMPSPKLFLEQDAAYKDSVIPVSGAKLVAVDAGIPYLWYSIVGRDGLVLGMDCFGSSGPYTELAEKYGFTGPAVAENVLAWLK